MTDSQDSTSAFVDALLEQRDELYRETVKLKDSLEEYAGVEIITLAYEKNLKEKDEIIAGKDKIIAGKETAKSFFS